MLRKILAAGLLTASLVVTAPQARADDLTGASRFLCSVVSVGRCDLDGCGRTRRTAP